MTGAICWLSADLTAQTRPQNAKEVVEESKQKPPAKQPKPEEEDPTKPAKPAKPLRVEDDEPIKQQKTAVPSLAELAKGAKNEPAEVAELYRQLWPAYDIVNYRPGAGRLRRIEPFPGRIADERSSYTGNAKLLSRGEGDQQPIEEEFSRSSIKSIDPFELIALPIIKRFREKHKSSIDYLHAAERALKAVEAFHESARETGMREGPGWAQVSAQVRDELRTVQVMELQYYSAKNDWESASQLAAQLADAYPQPEMHKQFVKPLEHFVHDLLKAGKNTEAQKRLNDLRAIFHSDIALSHLSQQVNQSAAKKAEDLYQQALRKKDEGKTAEAMTLLDEATRIWPHHASIMNERLKLSNAYPTMGVGVIGPLPQSFTPGETSTYAELVILDLLYESLVKPVYNKQWGQRYVPVLAAEQPRLIPLGREFELVRDAYWSDGQPVSGVDVRYTVEKLLNKLRSGSDDRQDELQPLKEARVRDDPYHVSIPLKRGFLDPLSLMSFKVLPDMSRRPPEAARQPIGSGPYRLKSRDKDKIVFEANGYYRRAGRAELPHIREIHVFASTDHATDFTGERRLRLLLDIPTHKLRELDSLRNVRLFTLQPRRVYFLAVNHRNPALHDEEIRRAIGLAIKREDILKDVFRPKGDKNAQAYHRPLNGPFPPQSWAYNEALASRPDPSNPTLAKERAKSLGDKLLRASGLSLKYPSGDPRVKQACLEIVKHVEEATGLKLTLHEVSPAQLRQDVEVDHKYDLAYYYLDYPNECYWLWPLFNPRATGPGGSNYLGYENDSDLEKKFHNALEYRDIGKVKEFMHDIHKQVHDKMPLIPLWQLDMHFAAHDNLVTWPSEPRLLDPLALFSDIEQWQLYSTR